MNHSVPNGSMKAVRYMTPTWAQPCSAANTGALNANWMVTHSA